MNLPRPRAVIRRYGAWIWIAVALGIIGTLQVVASAESQPPPLLDLHSARPNGALAMYLWLQRAGYRVRTASSDKLDLAALPSGSTLFLLEPQNDLPSRQLESIMRWVASGGRLVVVDDGISAPHLFPALGVSTVPILPDRVRVEQPLLLAPTTSMVDDVVTTAFRPALGDVAVAGTTIGPVLVRRSAGRGTIWLTCLTGAFTNQETGAGQNRRLVLNLAGRSGAILTFNEVAPPSPFGPTGTSDWLTGTVWGVAILFALANLLLFRWLTGRRLGPAVRPYWAQIRPSIEYALSLAALLRRAQKRDQALLPYQRSLQRLVEARFGGLEGLDVEARTEVERLLAPAETLTEEGLVQRATAIVACEERLYVRGISGESRRGRS